MITLMANLAESVKLRDAFKCVQEKKTEHSLEGIYDNK